MRNLHLYSEIDKREVRWLWYPYIPAGKITVLQGDPGEGKSSLMINLISMLTNGMALPGEKEDGQKRTVIYQAAEDDPADTVRPRIEAAGGNPGMIGFIDEGEEPLTLDDPRIESAIREMNASLFVIDPIQAFIEQGSDMTSAVKMRQIMRQLAGTAQRTGCAIVLIGHMTKAGRSNNLYRGLGSIDIAAQARSILMVVKDREDCLKRYMLHIKSSLAPAGDPVGFSFDHDKGFVWQDKCDISADDILEGRDQTQLKIDMCVSLIQRILETQDLPSRAIYDRMLRAGISKRTVKEAKKLIPIDVYKKGNAWYWHLNQT